MSIAQYAPTVISARRARSAKVLVILVLVCLAGFAATLVLGTTVVPIPEVIQALSGNGGATFTVLELRLPRAVLGVLTGAAFGMSGAVFQSLLRNPLASPDIIGISAGASAAAAFGIVVLGASGTVVSLLALIGACATAAAIALLAAGPGSATARMILVGIGAAAILKSLLTLVLSRASTWDLQGAMQWLAGSLNGAAWEQILPLALTCLVVVPMLLLGTRSLAVLRLGDDAAMGLGVRPAATRWALMLLAVVLLAAGTAAAGPIAFVAFLAGPVAARLHGGGTAPLVSSALVGSALVLWADLVGQLAFAHRYPVGVITGAIGAPVLIALLVGAGKRRGQR
ncbi:MULTISPECIES: iron chelate uptake ABC transporter family permease subunit [unclassified Leucobacter]|uniref:FecCD family ABC transporter permease n=1 Tax=unclassified Leucobacter TaxID=2621730 RepID=UPI00165E5427|nr:MULTISPECIES: iron chelate uptake ABC transporter family permease subunit [unclassified Leucobacter]MBC9928273.1 iron chelate uptake ABC transporter family permease subunit [Leucobacter sp. cx-169]